MNTTAIDTMLALTPPDPVGMGSASHAQDATPAAESFARYLDAPAEKSSAAAVGSVPAKPVARESGDERTPDDAPRAAESHVRHHHQQQDSSSQQSTTPADDAEEAVDSKTVEPPEDVDPSAESAAAELILVTTTAPPAPAANVTLTPVGKEKPISASAGPAPLEKPMTAPANELPSPSPQNVKALPDAIAVAEPSAQAANLSNSAVSATLVTAPPTTQDNVTLKEAATKAIKSDDSKPASAVPSGEESATTATALADAPAESIDSVVMPDFVERPNQSQRATTADREKRKDRGAGEKHATGKSPSPNANSPSSPGENLAAPPAAPSHAPQPTVAPVTAVEASITLTPSATQETPAALTSATPSVSAAPSAEGRLPSQLAARGPGQSASAMPLTSVEQVRLVQRVARAFQAAQHRDGELLLRLSPPRLGSLKLEIKVREGLLAARVEVETAAAQAALVDNLPALRERLMEQGIQLQRFDVELSGRQGQGDPGQSRSDDRTPTPQRHIRTVDAPAEPRSKHGGADETQPLIRNGRLNVTI